MQIGKERKTVVAPKRTIRKYNQPPKESEFPVRKPAKKEVKKVEEVPVGV